MDTPLRRPAPRLPAIDVDRCTGCGRCVAACEPRVLSLETREDWRKGAVLHDRGGCTGCSLCALRCPFDAIEMRRPQGSGISSDRAGTSLDATLQNAFRGNA